MGVPTRFALAWALSFAGAVVVQQIVTAAMGERDMVFAIVFVAAMATLATAVFALSLWRRRTAARLNWTAGVLLAVMLALGIVVYFAGRASLQPGIGGNIGFLLAQFFAFYVLAPGVVAVLLQMSLLRGVVAPRQGV